jgi:hypothetical protein
VSDPIWVACDRIAIAQSASIDADRLWHASLPSGQGTCQIESSKPRRDCAVDDAGSPERVVTQRWDEGRGLLLVWFLLRACRRPSGAFACADSPQGLDVADANSP